MEMRLMIDLYNYLELGTEPLRILFFWVTLFFIIFIKITPDHGPNIDMAGKNKSDPSSIFYAMKFWHFSEMP